MAKRISQAPNTYPTWLAPDARVELGFNSKFLTQFPKRTLAPRNEDGEFLKSVPMRCGNLSLFTERIKGGDFGG